MFLASCMVAGGFSAEMDERITPHLGRTQEDDADAFRCTRQYLIALERVLVTLQSSLSDSSRA